MKKIDKNLTRKFRTVIIVIFLLFTMLIPVEAKAAQLNKKSVTLLKGKTFTLQLKGTRSKAVWKTSKKSVVRFTAKKKTSVKVKALKAGSTTITAQIGKKAYRCKVQVVDPKFSVSRINLKVGSTKRLVVRGGKGRIKWSSRNKGIATINSSGILTAKRAGTVKVYATQNGKKLTCTIIVQNKTKPDDTPDMDTEKKPVEKKVWVVTEGAWIEYVPVYENKRTLFICRNCGFLDKKTGLPVKNPNLSMLDFYIPVAGFETGDEFEKHLDESASFFGKASAECGYYRRVMSNHPVYWTHIECSCGARFRINESSRGETGYNGEAEFKEHLANKSILFSDAIDKSCNAYTVATIWDSVHYDEIYHDEIGYWKTEYVYE